MPRNPDSVEQLCQWLRAPKRLVGTLDWVRTNSTERIAAAIELDGVVTQGLSFRMTCVPDFPDEHVAIVLLTETIAKPRPFARIDWRGGPHGNTNRLCGDVRHVDAGRTHFHDPGLHRHIEIADLLGPDMDLPAAKALYQEPLSFNDLLVAASDLLHIENLNDIPIPPWSPRTSLL